MPFLAKTFAQCGEKMRETAGGTTEYKAHHPKVGLLAWPLIGQQTDVALSSVMNARLFIRSSRDEESIDIGVCCSLRSSLAQIRNCSGYVGVVD
jgi:hypothetical protein